MITGKIFNEYVNEKNQTDKIQYMDQNDSVDTIRKQKIKYVLDNYIDSISSDTLLAVLLKK